MTVSRAHAMPFGAEIRTDGGVRFRLWAPSADHVALVVQDGRDPVVMQALADGWHEVVVPEAGAGTRYRFALENDEQVPDPASRYQPEDIHGPSEVIDPRAYQWRDGGWRGRPWEETVLYELHIGTFTPEGTWRAAIDRLDHLVDVGVTAIELMPVADSPGGHNWGYDGVDLFAPEAGYGRPDDLKALVDAAHARGIMVFLDVVYNHFGPEGNYLHAYARQFFTERHHTPWGAAINYDGAHSRPVRDFMIHNALYWLEEFNMDGLRLDAVHAILDDSDKHVLEELAERVHRTFAGRHVHLVLENGANEARFLHRQPDGRPAWYAAQWSDDIHHVLHVAATGESGGYYRPFVGDTGKLGRALAEGFAFQGEPFHYDGGTARRGEPSAHLPPTAFVGFIQNHDQVGNRAFGERLTALAPVAAVRAVAAVYLLAPHIPMLFMGEEWGAAEPFPFFCDFEADLAEAVRKGRREEFAAFPEFRDEAVLARIPDPLSAETFRSARLGWDDRAESPHAEWLAWYRRILAVRRAGIVPRLAGAPGNAGDYEVLADGAVRVRWRLGDGSRLQLIANLSGNEVATDAAPAGKEIWREGDVEPGRLGPWSVVWSVEPATADSRS